MTLTGRRHGAISILVALLLFLLPLPRHWVVWRQTFPGVYYEHTSLSLYPADAVAVVLVVLVVLVARGGWRVAGRKNAPPATRHAQLMVALALLTGLSTVWALDVTLAAQQAVRVGLLTATAVLIAATRPRPRMVQAGAAITLLFQAGVALVQFARQDDLGWRLLGEIDLNRYPGGGSILAVGDTFWLRGYGLTPHPNILGGVLVVLLLMVLAAFLTARGKRRYLWLGALWPGAAALVVTFSRSAWLGAVVGGGFFAAGVLLRKAWRGRYGRSLLLVAATGLLVVAATVWWQRDLVLLRAGGSDVAADPRFATEGRAISEREALIALSAETWRAFPLTGVGAGNDAVVKIPPAAEMEKVSPQPAHNVPLLLAAELGIVGGLLWLLLMVTPPATAVLGIIRPQPHPLSLWAWGMAAGLVALAVIDLFDYYAWGWSQGRWLRWLAWGLWLAAATTPTAPASR